MLIVCKKFWGEYASLLLCRAGLQQQVKSAVADEEQKALQDSESCVPCLLYKSQEFMKGHSTSQIEVIEWLQQIKELQYVFHSVY